MINQKRKPRILIVTPEVTYLPSGMGYFFDGLSAKAGGLADVSAALISALFDQGADVHVALPDYRALFHAQLAPFIKRELNTIQNKMPEDRIHLAEDRAFFYLDRVYSGYWWEDTKISLAFQREVINNIVPYVQPDLIHCNDWMTGLIPAMARQLNIPCLFTIHNIHTVKNFLSHIEDKGIDAASFWQYLYYENMAYDYENTRNTNPVDFLTSGVFAAHFVNTVSPTFLKEVVQGRHGFVTEHLQQELSNKFYANCAVGILNAPDPSFNPSTDTALAQCYTYRNQLVAKKKNKIFLQEMFTLIQDDAAPIFFWPSRLDPIQKGCQLLAEILYKVISRYWEQNLQIVFVGSGDFQRHFKDIVKFHQIGDRVAICDFDEKLSRIAYGASDFIMMPSSFEPCGLPQMIGPIYGSLPVAHDTGGIHDTVVHLDIEKNEGNGFLFNVFDSNGFYWAINQAMAFYNLPESVKNTQIQRIMKQSAATFNHEVTARQYIDLYEKMLNRPLVIESE
ncbi:MAG: glycogen/starch synthase [Desulfobacterales bacterium]|nr:glycogen/starch synthase [Desulfobacterales bacterium]